MKNLSKLPLLLFGLLFGTMLLFGFSTTHSKEQDQVDNLNRYTSELLRHSERLLEIFQSVGYYINKGNSKLSVKDKKEASLWVQENQKNLNIINKTLIDDGAEYLLDFYAIKINSIIVSLNVALLSNFHNLIKTEIALKKSHLEEPQDLIKPIKPIDTENLLISMQKNIKDINNKVDKLGYNKLNIAVRRLEEIDLNYGLTPKIKSVLLYSLITTITLRFFINKENVPERFYINNLKNFLDSKIFPANIKSVKPVNNDSKNNNKEEKNDKDHEDNKLSKEDNSFIKTLLASVISSVIVDSIKGDLGSFVNKTYHRTLNEINLGLKNSYSLLRGESLKISTNGYEYVSSGNTLEDHRLVGLENQKQALGQLVNALKNLQLFEKAKISINKAYLLTGPSGCGKSYLAKAVCGSINKNLEELGISNKIGFKEVKFMDIWRAKEGIAELIKDAQANAPCILFIDEIHLLRLQTEGDGKILTEFLTVLSGINSDSSNAKPVILIAATNRPDLLDPALLRSGRLEVIKVEKPNLNTRKAYFNIMLKEHGINTDGLDIDRLAQLTENCSYAQLDQVIKDSRFKAKSHAIGISSTRQLEESIDSIIFKIKNENILPISEESKKIIASQLAGKSLLQILFDEKINKKILKVTLKATIPVIKESTLFSSKDKLKAVKEKKLKYGNIFTYSKDEVANLEDIQNLELESKILLSGQIAEQIILGTKHVVKKSDRNKAVLLLSQIVYNGIKPALLSKDLKKEYENKILILLEKFEQETKLILENNKEKLQKIYNNLLSKETLSRLDLIQILDTIAL